MTLRSSLLPPLASPSKFEPSCAAIVFSCDKRITDVSAISASILILAALVDALHFEP